ncbi:MAG: lysozyme inhibitor LprI family protein [Janthinobacterium lividum]
MHLSIQHRQERTFPHARWLGRAAAALLLSAAGGLSLGAHAASFQCGKSASYSESQVCHNPYLSKLDDQLALAYQHAQDVAPDKQSLAAARDHQWQWRQKNCHDTACVQNWYERRLSELDADYASGRKSQRIAFELNLDHQDLSPDAAAAIRAMKTDNLETAAK